LKNKSLRLSVHFYIGLPATLLRVLCDLDDALLARIDQFVERLAAQQPGLKPNRSDAIRVLVHKGLGAFEQEER
jgi:metal-responsive CopG/Arc/MetJ family transcriptional regulator